LLILSITILSIKFIFFISLRQPRSTLLPYTTLFRSAERWQRMFTNNTMSVFFCCREAIQQMAVKYGGKGGTIVNVSSIAAKTGSDRKSTRLNSSHVKISYAVFCLKKKRIKILTRKNT